MAAAAMAAADAAASVQFEPGPSADVFAHVMHRLARSPALTEEDLAALHFLLGSELQRAFDFLDTRAVRAITNAGHGRTFYIVRTEREPVLVLSSGYCSCGFERKRRGEAALMCGHAAAVRLGAVLSGSRLVERHAVSGDEFEALLTRCSSVSREVQ